MSKLIFLNGPPGIGKSTLAATYTENHPLALDIDTLRCLLGQWMEHPESGTIARRHALEMARAHLSAGYDVIVPQLAALPALIDQFATVAEDMNADFYEVMLLDTRDNVLCRWDRHASNDATTPGRFNAQALVERSGGTSTVGHYYDSLNEMLPSRTNAVVIQTTEGHADETYAALLQHTSQQPPAASSDNDAERTK